MMLFTFRLLNARANVLKLFYDDKLEKHENRILVCNNLWIKL
jgi:hypothetical protein